LTSPPVLVEHVSDEECISPYGYSAPVYELLPIADDSEWPDLQHCLDDEEEDEDFVQPSKGSKIDIEGPDEDLNQEALPGMPSCLITGQPMREPVVAGDGHTYERNAITRWLQQSDISPLTGAKLPHKELVPNYLLISALSNAADATSSPAKPSTASATQFVI